MNVWIINSNNDNFDSVVAFSLEDAHNYIRASLPDNKLCSRTIQYKDGIKIKEHMSYYDAIIIDIRRAKVI